MTFLLGWLITRTTATKLRCSSCWYELKWKAILALESHFTFKGLISNLRILKEDELAVGATFAFQGHPDSFNTLQKTRASDYITLLSKASKWPESRSTRGYGTTLDRDYHSKDFQKMQWYGISQPSRYGRVNRSSSQYRVVIRSPLRYVMEILHFPWYRLIVNSLA